MRLLEREMPWGKECVKFRCDEVHTKIYCPVRSR